MDAKFLTYNVSGLAASLIFVTFTRDRRRVRPLQSKPLEGSSDEQYALGAGDGARAGSGPARRRAVRKAPPDRPDQLDLAGPVAHSLAGEFVIRATGEQYPALARRGGPRRMAARDHRRPGAERLDQLPARHGGTGRRRRDRLRLRLRQRPFGPFRKADRHDLADGAQHSPSGADSARHFMVRHRRGRQAFPRCAWRIFSCLHQHIARYT